MTTSRVVAIGECMLEVRPHSDGSAAIAFGGDTYNAAVYMARAGSGQVGVSYATVIGTDPYSSRLLATAAAEGLDTQLVEQVDGRLPGLYLVDIAPDGERHFYYYRDASAARLILETPRAGTLIEALATSALIYFSGVTLAIMSDGARRRLLAALQEARRAGSRVAFDTNYRPRLWPDRADARHTIAPFLAEVDVALPSLDDERALRGTKSAEDAIAHFRSAGVDEVIVKCGVHGAVVCNAGEIATVKAPTVNRVVDTTAAGDAFNGAYLAARLLGESPTSAARRGARMAAHVVGHPGAITPQQTSSTSES